MFVLLIFVQDVNNQLYNFIQVSANLELNAFSMKMLFLMQDASCYGKTLEQLLDQICSHSVQILHKAKSQEVD